MGPGARVKPGLKSPTRKHAASQLRKHLRSLRGITVSNPRAPISAPTADDDSRCLCKTVADMDQRRVSGRCAKLWIHLTRQKRQLHWYQGGGDTWRGWVAFVGAGSWLRTPFASWNSRFLAGVVVVLFRRGWRIGTNDLENRGGSSCSYYRGLQRFA